MPATLHWFRRDLRLRDNTALHHACTAADTVITAFIIDPRWFARPEKMGPFQTHFYLESLRALAAALAARHIPFFLLSHPDPVAALLVLARQYHADTITYNKEYEPDQIAQDMRLKRALKKAVPPSKSSPSKTPPSLKSTKSSPAPAPPSPSSPPTKTPTSKNSPSPRPLFSASRVNPRTPPPPAPAFSTQLAKANITLPESPAPVIPPFVPGESAAAGLLQKFLAGPIAHYADQRNFPANPRGTSHLSAHLNAGTLSLRQALVPLLPAKNEKLETSNSPWLTQLIWRDFYRMILFNHPHTVSHPFNAKYNHLHWSNNPTLLIAWQTARTGYPIVDAAITQLLTTGFMHNRLRMIAAMFLTKDLDCSWTLGERFFMQHLIDYDQAANVGGWQWSASTGTDAAPYFRIMNPTLQAQRFDPEGIFIKQMLPVLQDVPAQFVHAPWQMPLALQREIKCVIGRDYPAPIVDHAIVKEKAIAKFRRDQ